VRAYVQRSPKPLSWIKGVGPPGKGWRREGVWEEGWGGKRGKAAAKGTVKEVSK